MRLLDFSIYLILPAALWPGVDSASNRNEYQEFFWGCKGRPACKADNLTAICELTDYRKCGTLVITQPYGSSQPVTGIALPFLYPKIKMTLKQIFQTKQNITTNTTHEL
jgi:hypothetical protein